MLGCFVAKTVRMGGFTCFFSLCLAIMYRHVSSGKAKTP